MKHPLAAACLAACLGAGHAADAPPFTLADLTFSAAAGVSEDPAAPVTVQVTLTSALAIDPQRATWAVRRTRELLWSDPSDIWKTTFTDYETVASGVLAEVGATTEVLTLTVTVTPGRYGAFSLLVDADGDGTQPAQRVAGFVVIRAAARGFRPQSPFQAGLPPQPHQATSESIAVAGRLGIKWVRAGDGLTSIAPKRGADTYDFARNDSVFAALREHGILMHGELMTYGMTPIPTIGGKAITFIPGRKANIVVPPEHFGAVGTFGTWADQLYHLVKRHPDVLVEGYLRNEPWEGGGITNWHATSAYLREALAVAHAATKAANPDFLIAGVDSMDNYLDQIHLGDLDHLIDRTTHHNYGASHKDNRCVVLSHALGKPALENENWASPADFSVIATNTAKLAAGLAMVHPLSKAYLLDLPTKNAHLAAPRPVGQAIATWLHFVEDCDFSAELSPWALPYIYLFRGRAGVAADKHCAVVVGRIHHYGGGYTPGQGDAFFPEITSDGTLLISDPQHLLSLFDIEGNQVELHADGVLRVPLTEEPYYLRSQRGYDHLHAVLTAATAEFAGTGTQLAVLDLTRPLDQHPPLRVIVGNRLRRQDTVTVRVEVPPGWQLEPAEQRVDLAAGETRELAFTVVAATPDARNRYPVRLVADGLGGRQTCEDTVSVCVFRRGTPTLDGDLDDWQRLGAIPVLLDDGKTEITAAEQLWFPMYDTAGGEVPGRVGRFAGLWDDDYFYVMADITDPEPHSAPSEGSIRHLVHADHPYLYWGNTMPLFRGAQGDSLRLAFDVHPVVDKRVPGVGPEHLQHLDQRYHMLHPDYEIDLAVTRANRLVEPYASVRDRHLARLAEGSDPAYRQDWPPFENPQLEHIGEVIPLMWRFMAPGVPLHNAYPYAKPRERDQGPVAGGRVVITRTAHGWRYEAAIPWRELAEVPHTPGADVGFAWFAVDNGRRILDWTRGRSAPLHRVQQLHPTWTGGNWLNTRWAFIE